MTPGSEVIGSTMLSLWVQGQTGPVAALAVMQIARDGRPDRGRDAGLEGEIAWLTFASRTSPAIRDSDRGERRLVRRRGW